MDKQTLTKLNKIHPTVLNGKEYLTTVDIANLLNRSIKTIDNWCRIGNRENKLKAEKFFDQWLILKSDFEQFEIVGPGRPTTRDKGVQL